eukprot:TRINITY_DN6588_c0_g1_i1.p1 TRINITY_DN6588_c0_g1~~TRINITY_DN6588_c0_g1_i1.p1  ORF type:complete len:601 (-),score=205.61 TRINITY_DN6588_c0_g1_i1:139-1941(-)
MEAFESDLPPPSLPKLLKQLSVEAVIGTISVEKKDELKKAVLNGDIGKDELEKIISELESMNNIMLDMLSSSKDSGVVFMPDEELESNRVDEVEALSAIFGEDFQQIDEFTFRIKVVPMAFGEEYSLWLNFMLARDYPNTVPVFQVDVEHDTISYKQANILYDQLWVECMQLVGTPMLFEVLTLAQDFVAEIVESKIKNRIAFLRRCGRDKEAANLEDSVGAFAIVVDEEEEARKREAEEKAIEDALPEIVFDEVSGRHYNRLTGEYIPDEDIERDVDFDNKLLYGLSHYEKSERRRRFGITDPLRYCEGIASIFKSINGESSGSNDMYGPKIKSFETVIRHDLANNFNNEWNKAKYRDEKPEIMFHGTREDCVASIVANGLQVAGKNDLGVNVMNGTAYGHGIYLGKDFGTSQSYCSGDGKMLICAVLLGQKNVDYSDYWNFVVMNKVACVLPLFVVHFDYDQHKGRDYIQLSAAGAFVKVNSDGERAMGTDVAKQEQVREAEQEAAFKRAEFFFGKRFQILGVGDPGDVDDDFGDRNAIQALESEIISSGSRALFDRYRKCDKPDKAFFVDPSLLKNGKSQHFLPGVDIDPTKDWKKK